MEGLEVTWQRAASVWWLLAWRTMVGALAFALIFGFAVGLTGAALGWSSDAIGLVGGTGGALIGIVWGIVVVRMALRKHYQEFHLVLVPHSR